MLKALRLIAIAALSVLLIAFPAAAQTTPHFTGWIPENFAGFIRVDMTNAQSTLDALNISTFVASALQPTRVEFTGSQPFDAFFPLTALDLENATFNALISGWLGNELIIAYPELSAQFISQQPLLILPARDSFRAAGDLSPAIQDQDFLERELAHGAAIYHGDQAAIAITPSAILIGTPEDVETALLTGTGEAPPLIAQETYQAVISALPESSIVSAYLQHESAANALNFVLNGGQGSSIVAALGEALGDPDQLTAAMAAGGVDAVGVSLSPITLFNNSLEVSAVVHFANDVRADADSIDSQVLNFVPRSAMIVQSGGDGEEALQFALNALSMTNYAGLALGSFPLAQPNASLQTLIPAPTSADIHSVIESYSVLLNDTAEIDLERLLQQFTGSYAAAILPRPNNPLPVLNADADGLFVAQVEDGTDTLEQLRLLVETVTLQTLVEKDDSELPVYALQDPATGQSLLELTAVDDVLVAGTGGAVTAALRAFAGDNRLNAENRWQVLAEQGVPQWYFDVDAIYNVISPTAGGPQTGPVHQVAIRHEALDDQLVRFVLTVSISLT